MGKTFDIEYDLIFSLTAFIILLVYIVAIIGLFKLIYWLVML